LQAKFEFLAFCRSREIAFTKITLLIASQLVQFDVPQPSVAAVFKDLRFENKDKVKDLWSKDKDVKSEDKDEDL